jgi:hypothetical protein
MQTCLLVVLVFADGRRNADDSCSRRCRGCRKCFRTVRLQACMQITCHGVVCIDRKFWIVQEVLLTGAACLPSLGTSQRPPPPAAPHRWATLPGYHQSHAQQRTTSRAYAQPLGMHAGRSATLAAQQAAARQSITRHTPRHAPLVLLRHYDGE